MKTIKIKTIDVNCLEWFDKVNGNSYFAGTITINYGMPTETIIKMPFQYGYGDQYRHSAFAQLIKEGYIKDSYYNEIHHKYYEDHKIITRHSIKTNCKKRDLKNI